MSYARGKLVELVAEMIRQEPSLTEAEASDTLRVHRHTLQRALKASSQTFGSLKQACILEALERHFASSQPTSFKQLWAELGFSSASAFARFIRHATGKSPSELRASFALGHSALKRAKTSLDAKKGG